MWNALLIPEQLKELSIIRQIIFEGEFHHETIYQIIRVGEYWFMTITLEQNNIKIAEEHQIKIPFKTTGLGYYGFEIFEE